MRMTCARIDTHVTVSFIILVNLDAESHSQSRPPLSLHFFASPPSILSFLFPPLLSLFHVWSPQFSSCGSSSVGLEQYSFVNTRTRWVVINVNTGLKSNTLGRVERQVRGSVLSISLEALSCTSTGHVELLLLTKMKNFCVFYLFTYHFS